MGHPISDYSILKILMNDYNKRDISYHDNILRKFKIYGIIIHDPKIHNEFDTALRECFDKLDYLIGDKFLFFALTTPTRLIISSLKENDYFKELSDKISIALLKAQRESEESITAYTISQALNIDFDDLPVIVLTKNLNVNEFVFVKTNSKILNMQLREVKYIATRIDELSDNIEYFLDKDPILFKNHYHSFTSYHSIGKIINDFLIFPLLDRGGYLDQNIADKHASETLKAFLNFIKDEEKDEDLEKKFLLFFGFLSNLENKKTKRDNMCLYYSRTVGEEFKKFFKSKRIRDIRIDMDLDEKSEEESKIIYRTFLRIFKKRRIIKNRILELLGYDAGICNFDHSILVVPLCKIFEIEVNLSVVHWVRNLLNIEMPTYFKRVKPEPGNYTITPLEELVPNPRPVDFNRGRNHRWIAPKIGESELVCKTLYREGKRPQEIRNYEVLLNKWSIIRSYRNRAAHLEVLLENDFNNAYNVFNYIKDNFLPQMNNLKLRMKFGNAG